MKDSVLVYVPEVYCLSLTRDEADELATLVEETLEGGPSHDLSDSDELRSVMEKLDATELFKGDCDCGHPLHAVGHAVKVHCPVCGKQGFAERKGGAS